MKNIVFVLILFIPLSLYSQSKEKFMNNDSTALTTKIDSLEAAKFDSLISADLSSDLKELLRQEEQIEREFLLKQGRYFREEKDYERIMANIASLKDYLTKKSKGK